MQIMLAASQFGDQWPKSRYNVTCPTNNSYHTKDDVWFMICYGSYDIFYDHTMRSIGLEDLVGDERYNKSSVINNGCGRNTEVVKILEHQFATQNWDYWEPIFKENEIPYQRFYILRKVHYDAFGEKVLPTSPIRFDSVGDPVLYKSRPIGFDTQRIMEEYGYSLEDIKKMSGTSVLCYEGEPLPDSVFEPSYGPHSIRN